METLEIDESVLPPDSDNVSRRHFIPPQHFQQKQGYLKTRFHEHFMESLARIRCSTLRDYSVCGVSGIGMSFTMIYYMLDCLKKNDDSVHYIDLQKQDFKIETFFEYAKRIKDSALTFLILDHVTLFNAHYADEIRKGTSITILKVESDFTACASRKSRLYGKEYQLDEEESNSMWIAILKAQQANLDLSKEGREIYKACKNQYLVTPRLIRMFYCYMCIDRLHRIQALQAYRSGLEKEIMDFGKSEVTDDKFRKLLLHTKIIFHHIAMQGDYIFTQQQYDELKIAINIFHIECSEVSKEDLEKDPRFLEAGLNENDLYFRVADLVPSLAVFWRQKLHYTFPCLLRTASMDHIVDVLFQCNRAQKEIENLVVSVQKECSFAITPNSAVLMTTYETTNKDSYIPQVEQKHTYLDGKKVYSVTPEDLQSFDTDFSGPCLNVAKCALWIKQKVNKNPSEEFILHPHISNLMGVDYFCKTRGFTLEGASKQLKREDNLFLVKVASGVSHSGETIGKALEVIKEVLVEESLTVHVIILITVASLSQPYCLKRCKIQNASAININHMAFMERIKYSHKLLYDFLKKVISKSSDAKSDDNVYSN